MASLTIAHITEHDMYAFAARRAARRAEIMDQFLRMTFPEPPARPLSFEALACGHIKIVKQGVLADGCCC